MKTLRWSLLGLALSFLVVPYIQITPVFAEEIYWEKISTPTSENETGSPPPAFADPVTIITVIGSICAILAFLIGTVLIVIDIMNYLESEAAKEKWPWLYMCDEDDARKIGGKLEEELKDDKKRCDSHDEYEYIVIPIPPYGSRWELVTIKDYELKFDNSTGIVSCEFNGDVVFTTDISALIDSYKRYCEP